MSLYQQATASICLRQDSVNHDDDDDDDDDDGEEHEEKRRTLIPGSLEVLHFGRSSMVIREVYTHTQTHTHTNTQWYFSILDTHTQLNPHNYTVTLLL
jgi:hypothetical protein